jgi:hypothetical protein
MLKQITMFDEPQEEGGKYCASVGSPVYIPRGEAPHIEAIFDFTKAKRLIREIEDSCVSSKEKEFLIAAASRHLVFNYELIADYYSSASKEMQGLMEKSALVIIDFDDAIERGYVELCKSISKQYMEIRDEA